MALIKVYDSPIHCSAFATVASRLADVAGAVSAMLSTSVSANTFFAASIPDFRASFPAEHKMYVPSSPTLALNASAASMEAARLSTPACTALAADMASDTAFCAASTSLPEAASFASYTFCNPSAMVVAPKLVNSEIKDSNAFNELWNTSEASNSPR